MPPWSPQRRYVLGSSLNPRLAPALRLAGWDVLTLDDVFPDRRGLVTDRELFDECAREDRVLIEAGDAGARLQEALSDSSPVSTLCVQHPASGLSTAAELALLAGALLRFDRCRDETAGVAVHGYVRWTAPDRLVPMRRRVLAARAHPNAG